MRARFATACACLPACLPACLQLVDRRSHAVQGTLFLFSAYMRTTHAGSRARPGWSGRSAPPPRRRHQRLSGLRASRLQRRGGFGDEGGRTDARADGRRPIVSLARYTHAQCFYLRTTRMKGRGTRGGRAAFLKGRTSAISGAAAAAVQRR